MSETMSELLGRKVHALRFNADKTSMVFECDEGQVFTYGCDADCCSESWINHVSGLDYLLNATVAGVVEHPELDEDGTRQDCDKVYGYSLVTDRGNCHIEMRNSSNGYYGGWIVSMPGITEQTEPVTEDF